MGGSLTLNYQLNMRVCNGGLFLSAGRGMHPNRIITSYELIFVRSGSLDIAEEDRQYRLGEGDYLILYPRRRHWGLSRVFRQSQLLLVPFLSGNGRRKPE